MGYGQILAVGFCLQTIVYGTISVTSKCFSTLSASQPLGTCGARPIETAILTRFLH